MITALEANDLAVRAFKAGFAAGVDSITPQLVQAEADADHWYFEANNPDEARARRRELSDSSAIDVRAARQETAQRMAALDAAGKKAS
jgi:hypothetical protein